MSGRNITTTVNVGSEHLPSSLPVNVGSDHLPSSQPVNVGSEQLPSLLPVTGESEHLPSSMSLSGWNTCYHHCQGMLGQNICHHQCNCLVGTHFNGLLKCHKLSLATHPSIIASLPFPSRFFLVPIMFLNELQNQLVTNWCWFLS